MAKNKPLTTSDVIAESILAMPVGAILGGISGVLGRGAISFFNPVVAGAAGTFGTFAGVGLIALPLTIIPNYITNRLLSQSEFLKKHPRLSGFLADTAEFLITLGAVAAGAALVSSTFAATLTAVMIIPAILYALNTLCNVINACLGVEDDLESTASVSYR
ncbi:hypothetical protein [Legionella sp. km772]|uniref:hypothetical protein n=1 Tax=Legionella sp. km772 TaxID=2498111 RepID=UPI000F8EEBB3|nr:hypothetical protein [Legionella sp. km772]RUR13591.1 hypothetical protein ELY15_01915 [Legionella sp. km772]